MAIARRKSNSKKANFTSWNCVSVMEKGGASRQGLDKKRRLLCSALSEPIVDAVTVCFQLLNLATAILVVLLAQLSCGRKATLDFNLEILSLTTLSLLL